MIEDAALKYDLGERPSNDDWPAYFKVQEYLNRVTVADWLECEEAEVTQDEFEHICHRLGEVDFDDEARQVIRYIYEDDIRR